MHEPRATRVHLETLGCRLNEAELEAWARSFRALGCRIVQDGETADLLVVNTCAVTAEAVRKSRKLLRRLKREHPAAPLVVSGCAASLRDLDLDPSPAQVSGTTTPARGIDLIVDNADKDRLVEIAAARLPLRTGPAPEAKAGAAEALFARGRQRAFVKVQDGCRYQCTFCVTTIARGAERSRAIGDIVTEINAVVGDRSATGVREVILTGVQLGGYGREIAGTDESRLAELIEAVLRDTDVARLRLGSLEPWELPAGFWRLFEDRRLMPHLHMPMQSGSDTVLEADGAALPRRSVPRPGGGGAVVGSRPPDRQRYHRRLPGRDRGRVAQDR
jgi:threonylcarbamoyladenosine tRNA methylthiotransferase MtaB